MTDKTHNGWTNYETWAVNLWLTNDQGSDEYWREAAAECWEEAETGPRYLTRSEYARQLLADRLKADLEDGVPDLDGVYADLLNATLGEVNWGEVANGFLDGTEGYEPLEK